jgi:hypothetical protein
MPVILPKTIKKQGLLKRDDKKRTGAVAPVL